MALGLDADRRSNPLSSIADANGDADPPMDIDRLLHAGLGRLTSGVSPIALTLAYADWFLHLLGAPGKREQLFEKSLRKVVQLGLYAARCASESDSAPCIEPLPHDQRFRDEGWRHWPYNVI